MDYGEGASNDSGVIENVSFKSFRLSCDGILNDVCKFTAEFTSERIFENWCLAFFDQSALWLSST